MDVEKEPGNRVAALQFLQGHDFLTEQGISDRQLVSFPAQDGDEVADRSGLHTENAGEVGFCREAIELKLGRQARFSHRPGQMPGFCAT